MATILETLSIYELNKRRNDLLKQLKKVDDEIAKRNRFEESPNLALINELKEMPVCKLKIKIRISKKSDNNNEITKQYEINKPDEINKSDQINII